MKEEQIIALKDYIDAAIDLKIEEAFRRDRIYESVVKHEAEQLLDRILSDYTD